MLRQLRTQRVRDPVHGLIVFRDDSPLDQLAWSLLDAPEFQRLRRIRQLGVSEFVFPNATHTRFAHSIGVFHTARGLVEIIRREIGEAVFNRDRAEVAVVAALLHDLGHGPFSHTFEGVQKSRGVEKDHERWSAEVILHPDGGIRPLLDDFRPNSTFCQDVARLIGAEAPADIYHAVVSSSLDAARLDYLRRDRLMTGTGAGAIDFDWLMEHVRVGEIFVAAPEAEAGEDDQSVPTFCLDSKALPAAEQFLLARFTMSEQVYYHKTTRCAEAMIGRLLRLVSRAAEGGAEPAARATGLDPDHPLIAFFATPAPTVAQYLALDDIVVMGAMERMTRATDPAVADLARRLRERRFYKVLDLASLGGDADGLKRAADRINRDFKDDIAAGRVLKDRARISAYTHVGGEDALAHKTLRIADGSGQLREISRASKVVDGDGLRKSFARYFFEDEAQRDRARVAGRRAYERA